LLKIYNLINEEPQIVIFSASEATNPKKVEDSQKLGDGISSFNKYTSYGSDILGTLGIILSADSSGAMIKFSHISKLISRLRYIGLNYGDVFSAYLSGIGKSYDGSLTSELSQDLEKEKPDEILRQVNIYKEKQSFVCLMSNGNKGKFSKFGVDLFLIGKFKKDYISNKITEMKKDRGIIEKDSKRVLQGDSIV
jgi:hypothetical protein